MGHTVDLVGYDGRVALRYELSHSTVEMQETLFLAHSPIADRTDPNLNPDQLLNGSKASQNDKRSLATLELRPPVCPEVKRSPSAVGRHTPFVLILLLEENVGFEVVSM
ncbi:unnamed protein product [Dibothriocephalus latus]|uniref:Uncharacterized protein n=1 Tax=Dibothriocephalus latus TaxID=60516 RepID=A0A3P7NLS9_DIBLA|nr:unnamed protein product [Dibothriocephalus latus]